MDKKILLYFFALIIFFAAVGYIFFSNSSIFKNPKKSVKIVESVPTVVVIPTVTLNVGGGKEVAPSGWLIHTNNREGYSFKYPKDWTVNALKEDSDYLFGTTTISNITNAPQGVPAENDLKMDLAKTPQTITTKDTQDFEAFLNEFVNKDQKKGGEELYTLMSCKKDISGDFMLIENVYSCTVTDTNSNFPLPYQTFYFYKGPKLYSLFVYGKPNASQLENLKLFKQNLQLLD